MHPIGFSTGALALGDFRRALEMIEGAGVDVVELSALRVTELDPLVEFGRDADLSRFSYVSVHAPNSYAPEDEASIVARLKVLAERGWPIVVHPDAIVDFGAWRSLGGLLLVENMDKRKRIGRSAKELAAVFEELPDANLCFDIAHARQFDGSMVEAYRILRRFGDRVRQVHISEVAANSKHDRISQIAARSYREVAVLIPDRVPVVVESPVGREGMADEVARARLALDVVRLATV